MPAVVKYDQLHYLGNREGKLGKSYVLNLPVDRLQSLTCLKDFTEQSSQALCWSPKWQVFIKICNSTTL